MTTLVVMLLREMIGAGETTAEVAAAEGAGEEEEGNKRPRPEAPRQKVPSLSNADTSKRVFGIPSRKDTKILARWKRK